jgi:hypothetical protein
MNGRGLCLLVWMLGIVDGAAGEALAPPSALSEVVVFSSGRALAIAGHRYEAGHLVLELRDGGEIWCDPSLVERFENHRSSNGEGSYGLPGVSDADLQTRPFAGLIQRAADTYGVNTHLLHALIEVESGYDPTAVSPKGALGLMQLMPATAAQHGVDNALDAAANIDAGTRHLRSLIDRFGVSDGLAAYNAGESAVLKFGGVPPFPETIRYLERLMGLLSAVH